MWEPAWEVCQFAENKIYFSPNQKWQCFSKHCSHLIYKDILFKDFVSSSLSMNRLWAIFQLIYPFYSGLHTNNNRSKEHVFLLLEVVLYCTGNFLCSGVVYFFPLFSLLACPEKSVWLGCLRTWVPPKPICSATLKGFFFSKPETFSVATDRLKEIWEAEDHGDNLKF